MKSAVVVLAVVSLSGCATFRDLTGQPDYVVTQASPTTITIQFEKAELSKAQARANEHCKQAARTAVLRTLVPSGGQSIATFDCS